jgi:hypothetical protein
MNEKQVGMVESPAEKEDREAEKKQTPEKSPGVCIGS